MTQLPPNPNGADMQRMVATLATLVTELTEDGAAEGTAAYWIARVCLCRLAVTNGARAAAELTYHIGDDLVRAVTEGLAKA